MHPQKSCYRGRRYQQRLYHVIYNCSFFTHIVRINQAADGLQRAESVALLIELPAAGVPDEVATLLMGQNICCWSL